MDADKKYPELYQKKNDLIKFYTSIVEKELQKREGITGLGSCTMAKFENGLVTAVSTFLFIEDGEEKCQLLARITQQLNECTSEEFQWLKDALEANRKKDGTSKANA